MSSKSSDNATDAGGGGEGEATGNSEGGGTTMAAQKKRLRRVSFAEMTSVHFFDRDEEDNETPKEDHSAVKDGNSSAEKDDILGFFELEASRGEEEGEERREGEDGESDDEELVAMRRSFLRPIESPSSGSGFGSATSNDEDFFGPVSASFIRPDRLSDSEASDDNRDVTMDSTAFSMHFRSLARSDSGVDLKTPTGIHLSFEEKTSDRTNVGSSMELTVPKKLLSISPSPTRKRTGSSNSSDMSLVGDSPSRYDYGRLSPGLDALLAEGSKNLGVTSDSNSIVALESPRNSGNVFSPPRENLSVASELPRNFGNVPFSPRDNLTDFMDDSNNNEMAVCSLHEESGKANGHAGMPHESPSAELISSPSKQRKIFLSSTSPLKYTSVLTPLEQRDSSLRKEEIDSHWSASSIQKSISKLKLLEASPFSASLTSKIENLNIKPEFSKSSPFKILLEREMKSSQPKCLNASSTDVKSQFLVASPKKGGQISESCTDNSKFQDTVGGEHMPLTKESNAAGDSPSQFAGGKKSTGTPGRLVPSPESQKKLTVLPEHQNSYDLVLTDQFVNLQNSGLKAQASDINLSTAPFERLKSFSMGTNVHFGSPVAKAPASNVYEVNPKDDGEISILDKQVGSQMIENPGTPTREKVSHLTNTRKVGGSLQAGIGLSVSTSNPPWGEPESASSGSSVPSLLRNFKELAFLENAVDPLPQSASKKDFQIIDREHTDSKYMVDVSVPTSNQLKSPRKRRNEVLDLEDSEHHSGIAVQQRNPKLQKVGHDRQTLGGPNEDCRETNIIGHGLKRWTDVYSKFSEDGQRLAPPSIHKLNFSVIDLFEDVLYSLKKSKTYGMLCNEILPQRTSNRNDPRYERIGEIRLLLHQIMHEKAKLQLMCAKKKMLLGRLQLLSSGVQVMQKLKMNFLPKFVGGTQAGVVGLQNVIGIRHRDEDAHDKVAAMKQALEAVNKKKANFVKALHSFCKIKGEPSCTDCILLANDHLMRKSCHRFIRLGMQIWVVEDVKSRDDLHDIFLNYLDFIIQSFKFTGCPTSSFAISNKLDDVNIMKSFPNMDACKAFSFVLNAEITQKYIGSQSLARETQITSSFLGNLVDVVRELQLARIELRNLTQAIFHCPLVGKLNLHLCFICFKHGKKVSLILDMSCLNRGIYPSEILPSQVTASFGGNCELVEPITDEIIHAVKGLRAGYMRVLRLCRCISLVVQGSSK